MGQVGIDQVRVTDRDLMRYTSQAFAYVSAAAAMVGIITCCAKLCARSRSGIVAYDVEIDHVNDFRRESRRLGLLA